MCKYCKSKESKYKGGSRNGDYAISNRLFINNSKLVIDTYVNRRTSTDDYYESWGLECDGESADRETIFDIKFCPFCGKKLIAEYKPKIFLYINDNEKGNAFCEKNDWLIREFDKLRLQRMDTSSNSYYLSMKIFDIIDDKIKKSKFGLSLKDSMYLYIDKPKKYEFKEIKSFLSEGYDVFIEMGVDYQYKEYVIENLKIMKYEIVPVSLDIIRKK